MICYIHVINMSAIQNLLLEIYAVIMAPLYSSSLHVQSRLVHLIRVFLFFIALTISFKSILSIAVQGLGFQELAGLDGTLFCLLDQVQPFS